MVKAGIILRKDADHHLNIGHVVKIKQKKAAAISTNKKCASFAEKFTIAATNSKHTN